MADNAQLANAVRQAMGGRSGSAGGGRQGAFLRAMQDKKKKKMANQESEISVQDTTPRNIASEDKEKEFERRRNARHSKYLD